MIYVFGVILSVLLVFVCITLLLYGIAEEKPIWTVFGYFSILAYSFIIPIIWSL